MKLSYFLPILVLLIFASCKNQSDDKTPIRVNADSILTNVEKYCNSQVELDGTIAHICGVDGGKMKLITNDGKIVKIVTLDSTISFEKSLYKKRVRVTGTVVENRIDRSEIERAEKEITLLCHIDNTPCTDSAWVENKIKTGAAPNISKRAVETLKDRMAKSGKDYISIVTVVAEKVQIVDKKDSK